MKFFREVVSHLLKNAFEGHTKFSVADNTAVGDNPIRSISLDAVPVNNETLISLAWDGGEKLFEKTLSEQEASHQFDLISTDLAEVAALTKQGQYDAAKDLMKKLGQKYAENTGDIVDTNLPKLHNTQASADDNLLKQAKITMQNLWFSTTDELLEYQQKQKGASKPGTDQDHIPLWDKMKKEKGPESKDELAPPSLSYEDVENQKEKEHEDMQKHIDEKIKTELESALQEKAASVFGPDQVELVKVLRKNGRNWDEIKKILVKDFGFDKDATTIFVDEQRQGSDPTGIEVEPVKEEKPLTPPEELVSPETHEKLLQDHEDKKKVDSPVKDIKEPGFSPKEIMDIPEDDEIEKVESSKKCPKCGEEIWDVAGGGMTGAKLNKCWNCGLAFDNPDHESSLSNEIARADNDDIHKIAAPTDLNPLQEPIKEEPTTPTTPPQDVVPMGKPLDHNAPQKGDRVFVSSDLTDEKAGFEATFISTYKSKGVDFSIVETDDGDLIDIESHRVVKTSEGSTGAQDAEPVMEPTIEAPKEQDIPVTPKMDDFHTSSQDPFLAIKVEAETLLKDVDNIGKTAFCFPKDGVKKEAAQNDSAFEGNGWVRVWVDQDDVELDKRYAEVLKNPDENARVVTLKEIARDIAYNNLSSAVDNAGTYASFEFDSLAPSRFDRIDWGALANPVDEEEEDRKFEEEMARKYGPDAAIPPQAKSSLEPEVKKTAEGESVMDTKCEECGEPLGPEAFLSKWPVCGKCTKKRHKKVTQGSDFEKGISQNKTSKEDEVSLIMAYEDGQLDDAGILKLFSQLIKSGMAWSLQGSYGRTAKALIDAGYINEKGTIIKDVVDTEIVPEQKLLSKQYAFKSEKIAEEPEVAPKTQFKELKKTPNYVPKEQAVPASPELGEVLSKLDSIVSNLDTLKMARQQIEAKLNEEISKIDEQGQRAQMEAAKQESIEKAAVLIGALENKVVQWKDKLYTLQTEEIIYVPKLTPTEMLHKIYAKFDGAEKYVKDVLNGMLSLGKNVVEKTVVKWPNKKSSINKEASIIDDMNHYNDELLAALKELSSPL